MNKRRKSIAIALACAMLVGTIATTVAVPCGDMSFGMTVSAADIVKSGSCGENVTYTLDSEGTLTISGTGEMEEYAYDESPFFENYDIKKVIIENGVTSIGENAFRGCETLTDITIPDSVTSIGGSAFCDCTSLTSITIPDSVTSIGDGAFVETLWYENQPDGLVYAGKLAYGYKGEIPENTLITLEEGTTGIADYAFWGCTSLTDITIPDSVTSIGERAFADCTSLTNITIPESVVSIGDNAFENCTSFKAITGYPGTEAERYAKDNEIEFIALSDDLLPGDITGDGSVDIADSLFVARADAGLATLTDAQKQAADVNGDGSADIADALFIARVDAGLASL